MARARPASAPRRRVGRRQLRGELEPRLLDRLLDAYVEQDLGRDALVAAGFDVALVERVLKLVDRAEYKRRQYPPGTKVSQRAFGKDRRLPMTSKWREL